MQDILLPLFPLELVLLPSNPLPLHIFEDRYKELIGEAIQNNTEFGIVQAKEKGILNLGCTASVDKVVKAYPDGRMDILTQGRRRFEIFSIDDERPFLRGTVQFFDDEDFAEPAPETRLTALACFELLRREEDPGRTPPAMNDPYLSFKIAEPVADLAFRQTLLSMRSEGERLAYINQFLPDYLASLKRLTHIRKVAPRNGHGFIALGKKPE